MGDADADTDNHYHEQQVLLRSAQHAVNNLLQGPRVTHAQLDACGSGLPLVGGHCAVALQGALKRLQPPLFSEYWPAHRRQDLVSDRCGDVGVVGLLFGVPQRSIVTLGIGRRCHWRAARMVSPLGTWVLHDSRDAEPRFCQDRQLRHLLAQVWAEPGAQVLVVGAEWALKTSTAVPTSTCCQHGAVFEVESKHTALRITAITLGVPEHKPGGQVTVWCSVAGAHVGADIHTEALWTQVGTASVGTAAASGVGRPQNKVLLHEPVDVPAGGARTFLVHSATTFVCFTDPGDDGDTDCEDEQARIRKRAGVADPSPFADRPTVYCAVAGAIHYLVL